MTVPQHPNPAGADNPAAPTGASTPSTPSTPSGQSGQSGQSAPIGPGGPAPVPAPERGNGLRTWRAVEYATVPGYRPLLLDLHRPDHDDPLPLVVFVHGGGWRIGSRGSVGPMYADWSPSVFARLAGAGFAVATVDYRLSAEAIFPAQLEDVTAALTWLHTQSERFGLTPGRRALWGESAGGHLAALAALAGPTDPNDPGTSAVVDWYGPSDLIALAADADAQGIAISDPHAVDSREAQLLGAPAAQAGQQARDASPVHRVGPDAPPFLLLHGTADRFVPYRQSQRLEQALAAAGAKPDLHLIEGADHMWLGSPEHARTAFDLTLDFLREQLG